MSKEQSFKCSGFLALYLFCLRTFQTYYGLFLKILKWRFDFVWWCIFSMSGAYLLLLLLYYLVSKLLFVHLFSPILSQSTSVSYSNSSSALETNTIWVKGCGHWNCLILNALKPWFTISANSPIYFLSKSRMKRLIWLLCLYCKYEAVARTLLA